MTRKLSLFILGFLLVGCVSLPCTSNPEEWRDAVGNLSISTPAFTPVTGVAAGDKALAFGDLRKEGELAKLVDQPSVGITKLSYEALRAGLKARFAGDQLSTSRTSKRSGDSTTSTATDAVGALTQTDERRMADEYARERNRTFKSPETPGAFTDSDYIDTPATVQQQMWELLKRSDKEFSLSPSVKAALVAAYKLQMVNMEEYYNLEGFSFDGRAATDFLPYKMHFTATAEPGWYTRYHPYDGVVEVTVGNRKDYKILAVMPSETAQTLDQLHAALRKLQLALDLEGAFQSVAARAQLQYVKVTLPRFGGHPTRVPTRC